MSIFVDENQGRGAGPDRWSGPLPRPAQPRVRTKVCRDVTQQGGYRRRGIPVYASVAEAVDATGADASFVVVRRLRRVRRSSRRPRRASRSSCASPRGSRPRTRPSRSIGSGPSSPAPGCSVRTALASSPGEDEHRHHSGDIALAGDRGHRLALGHLDLPGPPRAVQQGVGQTTCVGIGGDPVRGRTSSTASRRSKTTRTRWRSC